MVEATPAAPVPVGPRPSERPPDPGPPVDKVETCLRGRVVNVKISGSDTVVIVAKGKADGVRPDWRVTLEDAARTPGQLTRAERSTTVVRFELTPDHVHRSPLVRLCPP